MHKIFGIKKNVTYTDRDGAYLIPMRTNQIGVIQTPKGYFFLGGGLEKNESHTMCIERECLEETGYTVKIEQKLCSAEAYMEHEVLGHFHPMQTYYVGQLLENVQMPIEEDHTLVWIDYEQLKGKMYLEMQNWALEQCVEVKCTFKDMKKVIVIGCPGSGKSTFSRALHNITKIPLFYLDMMYWNADRTTVENAVFLERLENVIQEDEWIIDGNYASTIELRLQACDTVIFLDYPLEVCLSGIAERKGKKRADMPWVEPEKEEDEEFMELVRNYNSKNRPEVLKLLEKYSNREIYIFKSREEADEFLSQL